MFSLVYGLYQYLSSKEEVKVLIVGLSKSGKTNFLEVLKTEYIRGYSKPSLISPTIGMNLARLQWDGADATLWDVGGTMRGIWEQYLGEADAIVYVVDGMDRARFGECASTLGLLLSQSDAVATGGLASASGAAHTGTGKIPVAVIANKHDLRDAAHTDEIIESVCRPAGLLGGSSIHGGSAGGAGGGPTARREYRVFEVSAATGKGVKDAADWILGAGRAHAKTRQ